MLKKAVSFLVLFASVHSVYAQNLVGACPAGTIGYGTCKERVPISIDNVRQIRSSGFDGPSVVEASWHKSEPFIVLQSISSRFDARLKAIDVVRVGGPDDGAVHWNMKRIIESVPVTQLEVVGDSIIVGTYSGNLLFVDLREEETPYAIPISYGEVTEILLHPTGKWLLVVIDAARLFRFDLEEQIATEIALQVSEPIALNVLAFSSAGHLLAAAGSGTIGIWGTEHWELRQARPVTAEAITDLLFADNDSHVIVLADLSVNRWSISGKSLTFIRTLTAHPSKRSCGLNGGDISPDGSLLMTTDDCRQFRAWDLNADAEIFIPPLDFASDFIAGITVEFSPDGRYLAAVEAGWGLMFVHQPE